MTGNVRALTKSTSEWCRRLLYVDRGLLILNKPSGLICQGVNDNGNGSGAHARFHEVNTFNQLLNDLQRNLSMKHALSPVHRLDKGTTGSLVLARSASLARELSQQFQQRTVQKTYLALVRGGRKSFSSTSGQIRAPLQYKDGRASLDTSSTNKVSSTDWELVASSTLAPLSLVRLTLHTGHKHQLRVHLAHCLQAPIVGDSLHSRSPISNIITSLTHVPNDRVFLHASHLSFLRYKRSGPNKCFRLGVCAPLPSDFLRICADAGIPVDPAEARGGVYVDGELVSDGKVPDVDGYWVE